MIKLDPGNVLLKPSHRRQLMAWLKRASRLSGRLGHLVISITLHRSGRLIEMKAAVADPAGKGPVGFRARQHDWRDAAREVVRMLTSHLHERMLHRPAF